MKLERQDVLKSLDKTLKKFEKMTDIYKNKNILTYAMFKNKTEDIKKCISYLEKNQFQVFKNEIEKLTEDIKNEIPNNVFKYIASSKTKL